MKRTMMNARATSLLGLMLIATAATARPVDPPRTVSGGTLEPAAGPLRELVRQDDWVGYRVPIVEGTGSVCCFDLDRGPGCRLASANRHFHGSMEHEKLQPGTHLLIFVAPASADRERRVHAYDSACPIAADGLRIRWLGDIEPRESLAVLGPWAFERETARDRDRSALSAIAHHAHDEATRLLADAARDPDNPDSLRKGAAFWLGKVRGEAGYEALRDLFARVDRPSLREDLVMALAQSPVPEALEQLIDIARNDRSPEVRGQGLFWLAQTASARVPRVLIEAAERDPEIAVKKKAVFALGQLPPDRGVPLLIDVAQAHDSAAVRERAIFWLGQSEDRRALDFIVSLLDSTSP